EPSKPVRRTAIAAVHASVCGPSLPSKMSALTSAIGGEADLGALRNDANDPTSDIGGAAVLQCKKNSPTRYRAESAQEDLAPLCAISPRCFYVRGARWSFHAAKTHMRHGGVKKLLAISILPTPCQIGGTVLSATFGLE